MSDNISKKAKKQLPSVQSLVEFKGSNAPECRVPEDLKELKKLARALRKYGYKCFPACTRPDENGDLKPLPVKGVTWGVKDGRDALEGHWPLLDSHFWDNATIIGVRLDGLLLLDIDGNKGEADTSELRFILAGNQSALFQTRPGTGSDHYLFRLPANFNRNEYKCCATPWTNVDLKAASQVVYLKPGKMINPRRPEEWPEAPVLLVEKLVKGYATPAGVLPVDEKIRKSLEEFNANPSMHLEAGRRALETIRRHSSWNGVKGEFGSEDGAKIIRCITHVWQHTEYAADVEKMLEGLTAPGEENWFIDKLGVRWLDSREVWHHLYNWARDCDPSFRWAGAPAIQVTAEDLEDDPAPVKKPLPKLTDDTNRKLTPEDAVSLTLEGDYTTKGELIRAYNTAGNVRAVLQASELKLCINQMNGQIELHSQDRVISRPSKIDSLLTSAMARNKMPEGAIRVHCPALAEEVSYHPVVKQLDGKEWDGVDRVQGVLQTFNFKEPDYAIPVMRAWLRATIAAAHTEKGFSSKLVPVLVGQQNAAKSSAIRRITELLPGCFTDQHFAPDSKDALIHAASHWVQEWAEMDRLKVKDMPAVKAYISSMSDSFRRPYARMEETKPRQGTIIGTANIGADTGVLKDSSGNVRFAVLETGLIDIEAVNQLLGWKWDGLSAQRSKPEELEQFWLQIKAEWLAGETTSMPAHLAQQQAQINEQYEEINAYDQAIAEYLHKYRDCATSWRLSRDITELLGFPAERVRPVGKALAAAVRRGQIESRNAGQRVKEYKWPIKGSIPTDQDLTD